MKDINRVAGQGRKYSTQVLCQQISTSFTEYEKLYFDTNIVDVYMYLARSNAIHFAQQEANSDD